MSCLLSKLNGEVDNASLPKIGELILHIENDKASWSDKFILRHRKDYPLTISVIGDGTLSADAQGTDTFTERTYNPTAYSYLTVYLSAGSYDIKFSDKYSMRLDQVPRSCTNNLSDFIYVTDGPYSPTTFSAFTIQSSSAFGNCKIVGELATTGKFIRNLYALTLDYCANVTGDLSDLSFLDAEHFTRLSLSVSNALTGDIKELGRLVNLNEVTLSASGLTGDVTELLDALYAHGKTSGTCRVTIARTGPTYNGEHPSRMTTYTFTFSESGWTLQS